MKPRIFLSSPHMSGHEQPLIQEAFDTNWIGLLGPHVNAFEKELQDYTGAEHVAALSAGTAAIHMGLILLGVNPGDRVICQSFTFSATANPIMYQGATPIFVDSEPDTWNMDPESLEVAILSCLTGAGLGVYDIPKAIIPVHLYGMPSKMDQITAIADKYGIPVLEDAAEAMGADIRGKRCGTFGKMGVLSFNGNKIITSSGGGALLSDDEQLITKARFLATQARDNAPHYQHSHVGYNYRMSNISGAIGRGQLMVLEERIEQRRANFERYKTYFSGLEAKGYKIGFQNEPEGYKSNRWLTCITIDPVENNGITRETLRLAFNEENIETRPLWKPMHLQPVFSGCQYHGNGVSERLFEQGLCLPSGSNLTEEEFGRIFEVLDKIFVF